MSAQVDFELNDAALDVIGDDFSTKTGFRFLLGIEAIEDSLGWRVLVGEAGALAISADKSLSTALRSAFAKALARFEEVNEQLEAADKADRERGE
jgi:hypothetical protein